MQENYGLGILREKNEPYCFPLSLKEIDELTSFYSKAELLNIMKKNDSTLKESDAEKIQIFVTHKNRWKIANIDYITKNTKYLLTFSMDELFEHEKEEKILNILYNHFSKFLKKKNTREEMKQTILAMKIDGSAFLESLKHLNYIEMRFIRMYLSKHFDVTKLKCVEMEPSKPNVETQEIPELPEDYKLEMKKAS